MEQQQYEFSEEENILVGSLAKKMKFVGIFGIIFGVLEILQGIFSDSSTLPGCLPHQPLTIAR